MQKILASLALVSLLAASLVPQVGASPQSSPANPKLFVEVKTTAPFPITSTVLGDAKSCALRTNGITLQASADSGSWTFVATGTDANPTVATITAKYMPGGGVPGFDRTVTLTIQPGETITVGGVLATPK
ncbi:MAG: hypothetical protein PSV22_14350 [Pseudolabrys sp.]|nr:hypothetical protein [Pseudolabrys sp.]